jgi:hypothetical protein
MDITGDTWAPYQHLSNGGQTNPNPSLNLRPVLKRELALCFCRGPGRSRTPVIRSSKSWILRSTRSAEIGS